MKDFTVLVIEDEKALQEAIKEKLKTAGYNVESARSVEEAFSRLEGSGGVDLIWLDHYLFGDQDGLDFVSKVKNETSNYRNIPIIVVSNTASADKVKTYMELGVDDYFVKSDERLDVIVDKIQKTIK